MKAKNLMVGDYVRQKHSGLLLKVSVVNPPYILAEGEGGEFKEDTIEAIPLTEEILKASGFKEHSGEKGMYGVTISPYFIYGNSPRIYCDGCPFAVWFEDEVDIASVHELQHLLKFCKVGVEIKIV